MLQNQKGITLVSLVITIIVLLILATVAITLAVNANGLFPRAEEAANRWNNKVLEEENVVGNALEYLYEKIPNTP